ncbi:hypothetical protein ACU4GD_01950 [Cupriavidus basilensis]
MPIRLSSFCHKVLIAFARTARRFPPIWSTLASRTPRRLPSALAHRQDAGPARRQPRPDNPGKHDHRACPDQHYPGARPLLPATDDERREVRLWDRTFDHYVHIPVQKIVGDRLRADGERDPRGVAGRARPCCAPPTT